jgi:hypothetical protein
MTFHKISFKQQSETKNLIWIELELPPRDNAKIGHDRASKLSRFLLNQGIDFGIYQAVWFDEKKWMYCFTRSNAGSFVYANDNGEWYDLDNLIIERN